MRKATGSAAKKRPGISKKSAAPATDNTLQHLAFSNTPQPTIISDLNSGKIILANKAACKLLGYTEKELMSKTRAIVFGLDKNGFKSVRKPGTTARQFNGLVTIQKKTGKLTICSISSTTFKNERGIGKMITTITDMSAAIRGQKNIDIRREKIVAGNILLVKSKQKTIDLRKNKVVAENISLAKSAQKNIDLQDKKIVAGNIVLANAKQKAIDVKKEKKVADNIRLAKTAQKRIDIRKEKIVAGNIVLAKEKQQKIDVKKDKVVANNILLVQSAQKEIDIKNEKIVADNIILAKEKQQKIDVKKDKVVADNILLVQSAQKEIDIKNEKIVADNIVLAKEKQQKIDVKKDKVVADNILLVQSAQKEIDIKNEKIVADNIVLAKEKQQKIDVKKEKIVANDIILAQATSDAKLERNNDWIKYIAKASYDVMWDWDVTTGQVYVGESVTEVFGYKVQNNSIDFHGLMACIPEEEKAAVEEKIMKALAAGKKSWSDSYRVRRQDGSVASVTSRANIIRDSTGKAIRLIGATQDVSKLDELEKKLKSQESLKKEYSEMFQLAAKLSYDGIWDWNMLTNEFFLGEGFEELFGYAVKNTSGSMEDWSKHLHPDDKKMVEKELQNAIASSATHWEHAYRFIRADGSVADVFGRASIIRDATGKAYRVVGAIHDLSRQKELQEKLDQEIASKGKLLTGFKESFKFVFNSSPDVLFDVDLITNEVKVSEAYEKEFGYKVGDDMIPSVDWLSHIHPDDQEKARKDYQAMLASAATEWKYSYRFIRADHSIANVISNRVVLRNLSGKAYRMIGSMQDTSKQQVLEEKLEREIKIKERQVAEAMQEARDTVRSDIGKELHDNVNQLLGASKLYLEMAKRGGENSELYLSRSSEYTLTAIEEIRKLTKGLTTDTIKNLGLAEAIANIARDTMEMSKLKIKVELESFKEDGVNDKFKHNIFRIVQEQLNNTLKHAGATKVTIGISQNKKSIRLTIADDGIGFDTAKKRKGIGLENIKSRAAAYRGNASFVSRPGTGCLLTVIFPFTDALLQHKDLPVQTLL